MSAIDVIIISLATLNVVQALFIRALLRRVEAAEMRERING